MSEGWEKDVIVLGSDGTNMNMGSQKGCIPFLEKLLGHPVHWEICLLHGNELLLRTLLGSGPGGDDVL